MRSLGRHPDQWNTFAKHIPEVRSKIERDVNRLLVRDLMGHLDASEYRVLHFIIGRTLGWQKFAEAVPMSHFLNGMRDADGDLAVDEQGKPYCRGVGLRKDETIRAAVRRLETRRFITVFDGKPGTLQPANVYMPFHARYLSEALIAAGSGVLPWCAPVTVGEHIFARDAIWQVIDIGKGPERLGCLRVSTRDRETAILPIAECERIDVEVWNAFGENLEDLSDALATRLAV